MAVEILHAEFVTDMQQSMFADCVVTTAMQRAATPVACSHVDSMMKPRSGNIDDRLELSVVNTHSMRIIGIQAYIHTHMLGYEALTVKRCTNRLSTGFWPGHLMI